MADGNFSLGLLKDLADLLVRFQSLIMLTEPQRNEILENVSSAVLETEKVFGNRRDGSRQISKNDIVADAWKKAGVSILKYLPHEPLGTWLQNKGEAWANPHKWKSEILEENRLQIEQIKERIKLMLGNRRKYFRPKNT